MLKRLLTNPDFVGLRYDPRFQALIAKAEARLAAANQDGKAEA